MTTFKTLIPLFFSALREDGRVEDVGDFSDFYIPPDDSMPGEQKKELQEAQDEVSNHGDAAVDSMRNHGFNRCQSPI